MCHCERKVLVLAKPDDENQPLPVGHTPISDCGKCSTLGTCQLDTEGLHSVSPFTLTICLLNSLAQLLEASQSPRTHAGRRVKVATWKIFLDHSHVRRNKPSDNWTNQCVVVVVTWALRVAMGGSELLKWFHLEKTTGFLGTVAIVHCRCKLWDSHWNAVLTASVWWMLGQHTLIHELLRKGGGSWVTFQLVLSPFAVGSLTFRSSNQFQQNLLIHHTDSTTSLPRWLAVCCMQPFGLILHSNIVWKQKITLVICTWHFVFFNPGLSVRQFAQQCKNLVHCNRESAIEVSCQSFVFRAWNF